MYLDDNERLAIDWLRRSAGQTNNAQVAAGDEIDNPHQVLIALFDRLAANSAKIIEAAAYIAENFDRETMDQCGNVRLEIASAIRKLAGQPSPATSGANSAEVAGELMKEEKAHEKTIQERDDAEQALSQAYYLITGRSPEWSNHFGYAEALEEIDDAQGLLRSALRSHPSPNEGAVPTDKAQVVGEIEKLINDLRAEEGDSVTILCDNPEGPPNNAIECCGDWTDWKDRRFAGASLVEALSNAYLEMVQYKAALHHGRDEKAAPASQPVSGDFRAGVEAAAQHHEHSAAEWGEREDGQKLAEWHSECAAVIRALAPRPTSGDWQAIVPNIRAAIVPFIRELLDIKDETRRMNLFQQFIVARSPAFEKRCDDLVARMDAAILAALNSAPAISGK